MPTHQEVTHTNNQNPHTLPLHPLPSSPPSVHVKLLHYGYLHTTRQIFLDDGWDTDTSRRERKLSQPLSLPIYGALLTLSNGDEYIWDLGWRNDSENLPEIFRHPVAFGELDAKNEAVAQNLVWKEGLSKDKLKGIIFSHAHIDHYGALDLFDVDIPCFIGQGTLEWINGGDLRGGLKSFPSRYLEQGRRFVEVGKEGYRACGMGPFDEAYDFGGDGSLWLVKTAGHCPGHQALLAHVGDNDWVFLAGDAAHHQSLYLPVPPEPYSHDTDHRSIPALFKMTPDAQCLSCMQDFPDLAWRTLSALTRMEMQDNVMVVLGHEIELGAVAGLDQGHALVLDDWRQRGWKDKKDQEGQKRRDQLNSL